MYVRVVKKQCTAGLLRTREWRMGNKAEPSTFIYPLFLSSFCCLLSRGASNRCRVVAARRRGPFLRLFAFPFPSGSWALSSSPLLFPPLSTSLYWRLSVFVSLKNERREIKKACLPACLPALSIRNRAPLMLLLAAGCREPHG